MLASSILPDKHRHQTVVIAGDDYTYTAQRRLRWLWTKEAVLIVNTPVKFAVEKRKLFLVDDDGKNYEFDIVKQVQKEAK